MTDAKSKVKSVMAWLVDNGIEFEYFIWSALHNDRVAKQHNVRLKGDVPSELWVKLKELGFGYHDRFWLVVYEEVNEEEVNQ